MSEAIAAERMRAGRAAGPFLRVFGMLAPRAAADAAPGAGTAPALTLPLALPLTLAPALALPLPLILHATIPP